MLRLGLTGGIASGKSTVGATLRKLGFTVLDADSIAHQLIEQGQPAYDEVVREFGDSILNADQRISRAALAKIVFADPRKLERLNAIIHPRVEERLLAEFKKLQRDNSRRVAFVEAALIIEAGLHKKLDGVVVVWCKPSQQLQRLLSRGLNEEEARRRIASQLSLEEKLLHATEKIDCSGSLAETHRQVEELATKLRGARPTE
jgi:dephospho-CoA kinase